MTFRSNPEQELRALWTSQGVSTERQDALVAGIVAKAQPGAMVGPFRVSDDRGADGKPQTVLPGAERASDATMAQRQANAPLKPKAAQRPCDDGLFSDQCNQQELF